MSTVDGLVEGLVKAVRSLPKEDKAKVIIHFLEDNDVREFLSIRLFGSPKEQEPAEHGPHPSNAPVIAAATPKEMAMRQRMQYVLELKKSGIQADQTSSVWAKTPSGLWLAIPFATERRPNRWFLGLPENELHQRIGQTVVVLLCQSASGDVLDFVLPPTKVQEMVPKLSKSSGQLKFNLKKVGDRYMLVIPNDSPVDVSEFKGKVSVVRG